MRTDVSIELYDGKTGCGILRGGWSDTLVLYLPCFGGNVRLDALPDRAGRFLEMNGISFLGFNLYDSWNEKARNLADPLTLEDHVQDIQAAIRLARVKGVRHVHVIAHSLSAYPALMSAKQELSPDSIILWDGSKPVPTLTMGSARLDSDRGLYIGEDGTGRVISEVYFRSVHSFAIDEVAANWSTPVLAVEAGANEFLRGTGQAYRAYLGDEWVQTEVAPECEHNFINSDEGCDALFAATLAWVKGGYTLPLA